MTRESKIGLLVGLGFVIVVGILLSEQVTRSSEPARASLDAAGSAVRAAAAAPGAGEDPEVARAAALLASDARRVGPGPRAIVPTQDELAAGPTTPIVAVGGATSLPAGATVLVAPPVAAAVDRGSDRLARGASAPAGSGGDGWDALATEFGGRTVGVAVCPTATPATASAPSSFAATKPPADPLFVPAGPPASAGARRATVVSYVARPGDTLGRLADRALGADTAAARAAIQSLNPSLAANPDLLIVGVTYRLPAPPPTRYTVAVADDRPASARPATGRQGDAAPPRGRTYTVQPGDSLWRIAQTQAGDASAVAAIQSLNASVLGGRDTVHPGMVLRLP